MRPRDPRPDAALSAPLLISLILGGLTAGCTQATDEPEDIGYVLLDRAARGAMTLGHEGWEGAPVLPVALDAGERVTLGGPRGARSVTLRGGMLAHVRGAAGEVVWLRIGEDARDDHLAIHGTDAAVAELAEQLGGESSPRGDGLWSVAAPDILDRGSFLDPPEGVLEALPDMGLHIGDVVPQEVPRGSILAPGSLKGEDGSEDGGSPSGSLEAELVGLYTAGARSLLLDAGGGFSLEDRCSGQLLDTGRFYAIEDRIVLQSGHTAPVVLGRNGDTLLHPGGALFAPLLPQTGSAFAAPLPQSVR